jgi:serine/threonine-protein kinase
MSEEELAGRTLGDRYDVLELIGRGGMGAVYRARDRELDELVALKVIRADFAGVPAIVDRFRSEVKLARRVTHHNVARTFELGYADGVMFCTMELIDGESLTARLHRERKLAVAEAVAIAIAVCDGLAAAHARDVIHRDIKPDNVLLASDGRVVVADFGVAAVNVGEREDLSGTPAYMAPEQARGEPPTPAADVYAIGLVLHEMLSGRRAFSGDTTKILADKQVIERVAAGTPDVPAELVEVIARATARDRDQRFQTAGQLRRALAPWEHGAQRVSNQLAAVAPREDRVDVTTVIVVAPTGNTSARFYLAEAIHEEVVARLGRLPRIRPQPRAHLEREPNDVIVSFACADRLAAVIEHRGERVAELSLPLAAEQLELAAASVIDAVVDAIELAPSRIEPTPAQRALDLICRARHLATRDMRGVQEAVALLKIAQADAPGNAKLGAMLAIAEVRLAFFLGTDDPEVLVRAREHARRAVAAAPDQVLAHLAMGHVEINTGDPITAAGHFRVAIACAPHSSDAHEQLGRMLLEAGYLEPAIERLEDAIAINPNVRSARWDIARAYALEQRWEDCDRVVADLVASGVDRVVSRARFAWWRRDVATLVAIHAEFLAGRQSFVPGLMIELVAAFIDRDWPTHRAQLLSFVAKMAPNRRRRSFVNQLVAEAAGYWGDADTAIEQIEHGIADGLFDLHWLDRCPMLEPARAHPEYPRLRAQIKQRADAILDALYGDHHLGTSDTAVASGF